MPAHRALSLCTLLAAALAACSPSGAVTLTPDKASYPPGGTVWLTLENGWPFPLGFNLCASQLRTEDGGTRPPAGDEACPLSQTELSAGRKASASKTLPTDLPAGRYVYVTDVEPQLSGEPSRVSVPSAVFEVTPPAAP